MKQRDMHDPESAIQKAVRKELRIRPMPGIFAFHPMNEGKRRASTQYANSGMVPGVPDWFLVRDGKAYALELKRIGGKISMAQIACHAALRAAGVEPYTAYGLADAIDWLERNGFLRPEVKLGEGEQAA